MRALVIALFIAAVAIGWHSGSRSAAGSPAPVVPPATGSQPSEGKGSVAITRDDKGHFTVGGDIAGVGLAFVVDTGASSVVLGRDDAARAGLRLIDADFTGAARTASGTVRVAHAILPRVRVGAIQAMDVPTMVVDASGVMPLLG